MYEDDDGDFWSNALGDPSEVLDGDEPLECLESGPHCSGPVEYWHSGGSYGRSWPRCTFHGERRLDRYENSMERYAHSDVVPDWFDPSIVGERWGDDY